jgi:hypothetical protein
MTKIPHIDPHQFGPWAIVTGASSGIGEEFARQLATNGLNLVLVARRLHLLEALGKKLAQQYGIQYRTIGVDLSNPNFMEKITVVTHDLDIGLLISNAGTANLGEFLSHHPDDLMQIVRLNVTAHLNLTHYHGQHLAKRGRGGIVLVGAMGASQGLPFAANDSATKAYVQTLGQALNSEWRTKGIHISVLIPSPTQTPILDKFGLDPDTMPMKPMPVEQCVAEGLNALKANRPTHLTGRVNRIIVRLLPDSLFRKINGAMLSKAVAAKRQSTI